MQRAVGTKPLIVGGALKASTLKLSLFDAQNRTNTKSVCTCVQVVYHVMPNYMEVDIDIGSSTVANNVVRFVLGCDFVHGFPLPQIFVQSTIT